jgi:aryl-alcohol dehydrogenase-like predicted oxidoreductase/predicted kinase
MRLSTAEQRDDARSVAVIHVALDAGATLLDTADVYCHDDGDIGHNEGLIAEALRTWSGDRSAITVATKGGLRRPKGAWLPDGRAKHLREACDASRAALGVECIDLYQLHAVDPKVEIETSVRALAALQKQGKIRDIGLCNVTVSQIERARAIADIACVQVSLSVLDDENLRNGVAEYCRDNGIRLIAYRPLGGERIKHIARDPVLTAIAEKHGASAAEIALAWLMCFDADVVPVPGATRVESAQSIARVRALGLDNDDKTLLDAHFSGRFLRVPRAGRRPAAHAEGDVVIVMGMPGAGKTTLARDLEAQGYERLNRDALGGSLSDLIPRLDAALAAGRQRVVLDNTYATRSARNDVIETAWARGVPVRCIWLDTSIGDAQINAISRMIEAHGSLPSPADIRARSAKDPRYMGPDAQFRYERTVEPPVADEGFAALDVRSFTRAPSEATQRAILLDVADLIEGDRPRIERLGELARRHSDGWLLFAHAWRPNIARAEMESTFAHLRAALGVPIDLAYCEHEAGPPVCWCRKPIPGSAIEFAMRRDVALNRSTLVGASAADRTMAERIGVRYEPTDAFFDSPNAPVD